MSFSRSRNREISEAVEGKGVRILTNSATAANPRCGALQNRRVRLTTDYRLDRQSRDSDSLDRS